MTSVIFVGNDNDYSKPKKKRSYVWIHPLDIIYRIVTSLIPPVGSRFCKIYVDLIGPSLALLFMGALLHYGHQFKLSSKNVSLSPTESLLLYAFLMPISSYILARIGRSKIDLIEIISLLGYSMFGHVFTLSFSLLCYQEESNAFFFICFFIFGGLSALRVLLVLLASIPLPIARLLVCSLVTTSHLLFLIFIHFTYMHRTFVYGAGDNISNNGRHYRF